MRSFIVHAFTPALALAAALTCAGQASAGISFVTVSADEHGNGSINNPGYAVPLLAMPGFLSPDTGPGGLPSVLTYAFTPPQPGTFYPPVTIGDLRILESPGGPVSDLIRFTFFGGNLFAGGFYFYSDLEPGDPNPELADVGLPSASLPNTFTLVEGPIGGGLIGVIYTPTSGQPGFVSGHEFTYTFISDADVPTPGAASLLALGGLLAARRRR